MMKFITLHPIMLTIENIFFRETEVENKPGRKVSVYNNKRLAIKNHGLVK